MEVTNEDKIALLRLLGYKYGDVRRTLWSNGQKGSAITLDEFDPLDIVILTKALDIIEKEHKCRTSINYAKYTNGFYYDAAIFYEVKTLFILGKWQIDIEKCYAISPIREEAILEAIFAYIKQQK